MKLLTKTDFIHYLRCPESLWLTKNKPDEAKKGKLSFFLQKIIDEGYEVEAYAEQLFPHAIKLPDDNGVKVTLRTLQQGYNHFFQAAFETLEGGFARVDVLERLSDGTWHLFEIKSSLRVSTKKSHNHIFDACFQKYVLEKNGLYVSRVSIIHLNKGYRRQGEIKPSELLETTEVTNEVTKEFPVISRKIHEALKYIQLSKIDKNQCSCLRKTRSNHCDNFDYFNFQLPKHPVHEIKRITEKKLTELLDSGHKSLSEVPDNYALNNSQKSQVNSFRQRQPQIEIETIKRKLDGLVFPLHFYDYETYSSAIPKLDGIGPHQHIPFQVSIHTLSENGNMEHFEYLGDKMEMPNGMIEGMKEFTGTQGTFISWHASFENSRNKEMALLLPTHSNYLDYISGNTFDLEEIFTTAYIDYRFAGSSSIKKVLPVLIPELSYDNLQVQDGTMAMDIWSRLVLGNDIPNNETERIRKDLLAYCKLDTLAMVEIYQYLIKLINQYKLSNAH
ncbi:DUF2779 domain-containing protein [Poritiphilus flavus]|uniref:DUF2779 domain-containing protein n=1 Tax=Poritiphilus flavus TaxID=2697053 RepID=A0A6L9EHT6_9FLAO|nr:DUF2779 domain-containing protein [Poritiphilus flavus]NAS14340.1 DUF2779 domain-containing protein [Poritiphilus flavus]